RYSSDLLSKIGELENVDGNAEYNGTNLIDGAGNSVNVIVDSAGNTHGLNTSDNGTSVDYGIGAQIAIETADSLGSAVKTDIAAGTEGELSQATAEGLLTAVAGAGAG